MLFKTQGERQQSLQLQKEMPTEIHPRAHFSFGHGEKKILLHIDFSHLHTVCSLDAHKEDSLA